MSKQSQQYKPRPGSVIIAEPELTLEELHKVIKEKYNLNIDTNPITGVAAIASDDPKDTTLAIIQPRYNETQYDILEDVFINDWTANECVNKQTHFMMGKHGRTSLDTLCEYATEAERIKELMIISKNAKFRVIKSEIDKLNKSKQIDFYNNISKAVIAASVFGRAAIQIGADDKLTGLPTSFKLLNSRRLNRVKVNKETFEIVSVEYLDIKEKTQFGDQTVSDDEEKFIPMDKLIWFVNDDGNVSNNSQFTGVSRLEPIINISQVKRIIMNKNIKEGAHTHSAGILIAQFPPDTDDQTMLSWIVNAGKSAGRWFAHKLNVMVQHFKVDTDLEKYGALVELIDRAIIRCIGIPSFLVGYEQIANYANSEQVLIAYREGDLTFMRTWLKDILKRYYLEPLFKKLLVSPIITKKAEELKTQLVKRAAIDIKKKEQIKPPEPKNPDIPKPSEYDEPDIANEEPPEEVTPPEEQDDEDIIDENDVTISYEFADITFMTRKETAESLKIISDMGVPLPMELVLRATGLEDWVEEIQSKKEEQDAKKAEQAQKNLEVMKMNLQNNNNGPPTNIPPNPNVPPYYQNQKTNTAVAESEDATDRYINEKMKRETIEHLKKLKLYQSLEEKINGLK